MWSSKYRAARADLAEKLVMQKGALPCIVFLFTASIVVGFFLLASVGTNSMTSFAQRDRQRIVRLLRQCAILSGSSCVRLMETDIDAENLLLRDIIEYIEWDNRSSCALAQHFGGDGLDGQKAVCLNPPQLAPPFQRCVVYSLGDGRSFDETMTDKFGCRVVNPSSLEEIHRNSSTIDYLKMDVNWTDWFVLSGIVQSMDKVRQLSVEIRHLPFTYADNQLDQFRRLFVVIRSIEKVGMVRFDSKRNFMLRNQLNYTRPIAYELAWYNSRFLSIQNESN